MFYIKNIKINNVRCLKSEEFCFDSKINILIGNNGCGKTSVAEAISYLCLGKSFKNAKDSEVLRFNEQYFNIIANYRIKKSGSGEPAKRDIPAIKQMIKAYYATARFSQEEKKLFVQQAMLLEFKHYANTLYKAR